MKTTEKIVAGEDGTAYVVQSIRRVPEEMRWDGKAIMTIRTTPWEPVPGKGEVFELPEPIILERSPLAVLALRDIGDDRMEMEVRLLVTVGVVLEQADREVPGGLCDGFAFLDHPGLGRILLSPVQRFEDGFAVGGNDPLILPDERQQRPALGNGESEIIIASGVIHLSYFEPDI